MSKSLFKILIVLLLLRQQPLQVDEFYDKDTSIIANFQLPQKKKSVIFLRAPYKNKLARLNIVNLEFTTIVSIKKKKPALLYSLNDMNRLGGFLFSTHKLKHAKTKVNFYTTNIKNFTLKSFN